MLRVVTRSVARRFEAGPVRTSRRRFPAAFGPTLLGLFFSVATHKATPAVIEADKSPLATGGIRQVRSLSKAEAQRGLPVKVRGVVTYYDPKWDTLFIQDETAGTYVYPTQRERPRFEPGQLLEVEGRTVAGAVANSIIEERISVLGTAPLPTPIPISFAQMANGKLDSQWIEIEGTVRGITTEWQRMEIDLAVDGGRFRAHLPRPPGQPMPIGLVHARVRVRGVCGTIFNQKDEVIGERLFVPGTGSFTVAVPALADPFQLALTPLTNALAGDSGRLSPSRVHVAGVVTLRWRSGKVFIQDGPNGIEIELAKAWKMIDPEGITYPSPAPVQCGPGDRIEAVGYPSMHDSDPVLEEAEVRALDHVHPIEPVRMSGKEAATGEYTGTLVQTEARLVHELPYDPGQPGVHRYRLRSGNVSIEAQLESDGSVGLALLPGSLLRVTGVCAIGAAQSSAPRAVRLFLRGPADVMVLHGPPLWTRQEMLRGLGGAAMVLMALVVWMLFLWYQARQKSIVNQQLEASIRTRTGELVAANEQLHREVAERSRAQAALQESQARIRTIVEHNPEAIVVFDMDAGRFIEVNENAARLFGMTREDLLDRGPVQLSPPLQPDGRPSESAALAKISAALADESPVFEWTHRNAAGNDFPCEVRLARIPAENRRLVVGTLTNITERKRAERVRQAVYQISETVHTADDLPSLYRQIHEVVRRLISADNFYIASYDSGTGLLSFPYYVDERDPTPPTRRLAKGFTEQVLRTGEPLLANRETLAGLAHEGRYESIGSPAAVWLGVPLSIQGKTFGVLAIQEYRNPNAFGGEELRVLTFVAEQIALAIDRTRAAAELRASAQRLRQSEERFSRAFHASPALVTLARLRDGVFVEVNETSRKLSGYSEAEILGRSSIDLNLWADPRKRAEFLDLLKQHGSVRDRECVLRSKDGKLYTALLSGELIEVDGEPYLLTVGLDITARKQAEQELLKSLVLEKELGELKSNFVSMVSHEFRTPLGVILSSAEILDRYLDRLPPESRREHLDAINQSVRRMSRLMEEVLLLSKVEAGQMRCAPAPVELAPFCRRLVDETLSATGHQCPIHLETEQVSGPTLADENLLRHIFTNLLSNAVKYSPHGTPVDFRVRGGNGRVVFEVKDRGLGIPAADQSRLFKAFHRGSNVTHLAGTGLGLTIVRRCVDLHGGTIEFESAEGMGATFTVALPLGPSSPSLT